MGSWGGVGGWGGGGGLQSLNFRAAKGVALKEQLSDSAPKAAITAKVHEKN